MSRVQGNLQLGYGARNTEQRLKNAEKVLAEVQAKIIDYKAHYRGSPTYIFMSRNDWIDVCDWAYKYLSDTKRQEVVGFPASKVKEAHWVFWLYGYKVVLSDSMNAEGIIGVF